MIQQPRYLSELLTHQPPPTVHLPRPTMASRRSLVDVVAVVDTVAMAKAAVVVAEAAADAVESADEVDSVASAVVEEREVEVEAAVLLVPHRLNSDTFDYRRR